LKGKQGVRQMKNKKIKVKKISNNNNNNKIKASILQRRGECGRDG
jgi:hypothetical protein